MAMFSSVHSHRGSPYAQELINHILPHCTTRRTVRGERLDLQVNGQGMCYLILEGTIAVYRKSDNMMLSTARNPAIFGVANLTDNYFNDYLKNVSPGLIGIITTEKVAEIITKKALWGLLSRHLMFVYNRLYHDIMPQGGTTAYAMIRHQLINLMEEDESYRRSVAAERYIRDKTLLSRSGVMRILADLKTGGFIEVEEGRLIKINKLPARY